jgi:microcystin-dependent protein
MFAGNFAPRGWAFCDGQLLAVSSNDALFSLLGTTYGGDGRTTFGLPDLRGRLAMHAGSGPGLTPRQLGAKSGSEKVSLAAAQVGSHTHQGTATSDAADTGTPTNALLADTGSENLYRDLTTPSAMAVGAIGNNPPSGGVSHENRMPSLCINFIVALFGVFPSRN